MSGFKHLMSWLDQSDGGGKASREQPRVGKDIRGMFLSLLFLGGIVAGGMNDLLFNIVKR